MKTYDEVYNDILVPSLLARFRLKKEQLVPNALLVHDLGLDSLDLTDLICEVEDRYGQELVPNDDKALVESYRKTCAGSLEQMTNFLLGLINEKEEKNGGN